EQAALQHAVFGRLDTGDGIGRRHGYLLGFLEDVGRVAVQHHGADLALGNVRPDLGSVQRVVVEVVQIFRLDHLDVQIPFREVTLVDALDQVAGHVVEV